MWANLRELHTIKRSYAYGLVTTGATSTGGLIGGKHADAADPSVSVSYWNKDETRITTDGFLAAEFGKTTSELQTPTTKTGIYGNWSTDTWDFVHAKHYPVLKADWDGDGTKTWQEFGDQPSIPGFASGASIADVALAQYADYTSPALPAASHGNGTITYSLAGLPSGMTLGTDRKITGEALLSLGKTVLTYKATDSDGDSASLTFTMSITPQYTSVTGTAGNKQAVLTWVKLVGVTSWQIKQDSGDWTDIAGSSASTGWLTVTGLTNLTAYSFKVRAVAGTGSNRVYGAESVAVSVTPDGPTIGGTIADQVMKQGEEYVSETAFPLATGGTGAITYSVPIPPGGIGYNWEARKLQGTPRSPSGKRTLSYIATDTAGAIDTLLFNISIQPKAPTLTGAGGNTEAVLSWDANSGVTKWQIKQGSAAWTDIASSSDATNSRTATGLTNGTAYTFKVRAVVGSMLLAITGVESNEVSVTPNAPPTLTGPIADQELTQGTSYTSGTAFPAATDGVGTITYSVADLPSEITLNSDRKLTGTATSPLAKTSLTYTATDANDDTATLTFDISVAPKATTLTGAAGHKQAALTWTAIAGVAKWQYQQGAGSWTDIAGSGAATTSFTVTPLVTGTAYSYKVRAVVGTGDSAVNGVASNAVSVTTPAGTDYDTDDDGLIEVANLAQLNAIRWDLNGDGAPSTGNEASYATAYPTAATGMGCPTSGTPTGCIGYELTTDLDFDTDADGDLDTDDDYWNSGNGFRAIGRYTAILDGNGNAIRNLRVRHSDDTHLGLFAKLKGTVRNLGLEEVTISVPSSGTPDAGAVAGRTESGSLIERVYVAGGADVRVFENSAAGGIVGRHEGGVIAQSYVTNLTVRNQRSGYVWAIAGGIVGECSGAAIRDTWSDAAVESISFAGGLVGLLPIAGTKCTIQRSYAYGTVDSTPGLTNWEGGIIGGHESGSANPTVQYSYWDKEASEQTRDDWLADSFGKTTAELGAPESNTGIYANWNPVGADVWDFLHAGHYPLLKVDFDGDGTATFRQAAVDPGFADQELTQGTAYTSATAFPEATGGNGTISYSVADLPTGVTLGTDRKLTGTATAPLAVTELTYTATDADDDTGTLTFNISAAPEAVTLSGAPGNGAAHLSWTAIAGVDGWEYLQNEKGLATNTTWAAITGSGATTAKHTVTGLDNDKEYDFTVRAFIGTGDTLVNGVKSDLVTVDPADQTPTLTGTIADQELTQGTSYTSGTALPAATGGDAPLAYSVANLPSGITLGTDRKLTGTATAPLAVTELTYTATDADDDTGTLTFNISVAPQKPASFTATAFDTEVDLVWTAIAGVAGWEVKQGSGSWTEITGSGAATNSHTVTSLTNDTAYTFKVRAHIGSGDTLVNGVESDAKSATPSADLVPALTDIADKLYVQGAAVDETLPAATGGDSTTYAYTLTPDVSGIGLTFDASTRKLGGTPSAPKAKVEYTYTATESSDTDGTTESTTKTFTIGIKPKATTLTGAAGNGVAHLSWTAIAGVAGWEYLQNEKGLTANSTWTAITGSGATTAKHTVTGLDNTKEYDFKVRAVIGTGDTLVDGVESNLVTVNVADQTPALTGTIADQALTQGTSYTSGTAFPAATGGDAPLAYSVASLPSGISLNSARKLTGTATAPLAKTSFTYTVTDAEGDANNTLDDDTRDTATLTFNISVAPKAVTLSGSPGNGAAHLSWTAITGVGGWEYLQNEKDATSNTTWVAITGSGATTAKHTVTGLDNSKEYDFKVRAFVGTGVVGTGTRVDGVESNKTTVNVADQTPALTGSIADQALTQGASYTSGTAFPAGTGGDAPLAYSVASLPTGVTLNDDRKLTGTHTSPLAKTSLTYTVTDAEGDSDNANDDDTRDTATLTFNISVAPQKPADFTATAFDTYVDLSWTAIAGVAGWEYQQGTIWTAIADSGAGTASHRVTGLTNGPFYGFRVRAHIGSGNTLVNGVETDPLTAVPSADKVPALEAITNKVFVQGGTVDRTLPAATAGDGHPNYTYTLTPDVSGIGLTFDAATRKLGGTPSAPKAKVTYTYTATESSDTDGTTESTSKTFTIGIRPKAVTDLAGAAGNGAAHLSWTAIAGVSGWEYLQNEKGLTTNTTWVAITGSGATTVKHTVTGLDNAKEYDFNVRAFVGTTPTTRVDGVESNMVTVNVADQTPTLTGTIADQELTQGTSYTSGTALPAATGGDAPLAYSVASLPSGISLNSDRKLTGTATGPLAVTSLTYTVTDAEGDSDNALDDDTQDTATLTFNISVAPQKPANFSATPFDTSVTLDWTAIAGVAGWEVKQGSGSWTAITGSDATTKSHTITSLTNGTAYTFKVRAYVGTGVVGTGTRVNGVESDAKSATPSDDLVPVVATIANKLYVQGVAVAADETLPAATGGDSATFTYTLTPNVSGIGLTFTASTRKLSGTPSAPKAQVTYTYTATETSDSDGTTESTSKTFTIGIEPKAVADLAGAAGNGAAHLSWTALAGVDGWEYLQNAKGLTTNTTWAAINGSGATTAGHKVTGLDNSKEYDFKVRAHIGSGDTLVNGVESNKATVNVADQTPTLTGTIADQALTQGTSYTSGAAFPAATGGDAPLTYSVASLPTGVTLNDDRKLTGTHTSPLAKTSLTYTVTDAAGDANNANDDDTRDTATLTFNISVAPQKPASFTATGGVGHPGEAGVDGHCRRIRLGSQAGYRQLDGHHRQRRGHELSHRNQPHQRHGVHLQGAGLRRDDGRRGHRHPR